MDRSERVLSLDVDCADGDDGPATLTLYDGLARIATAEENSLEQALMKLVELLFRRPEPATAGQLVFVSDAIRGHGGLSTYLALLEVMLHYFPALIAAAQQGEAPYGGPQHA